MRQIDFRFPFFLGILLMVLANVVAKLGNEVFAIVHIELVLTLVAVGIPLLLIGVALATRESLRKKIKELNRKIY